jgi:hypothetical protein
VLDLDGKKKAPPPVALIVVVVVEVKGASQESACWRFLRNASKINIPSDSALLCARVLLNVRRSANGSLKRFARAPHSHP